MSAAASPCLASILSPRNLQRLSRNTSFASCHPSLVPYTKSLVLSRLLSAKPPSPPPEPKTMSTHAHTQFEEGNLPYVTGFKDKGKLAIPPAKRLAIGPLIHHLRRGVKLACVGRQRRVCALKLTWPLSDLYGCAHRVSGKKKVDMELWTLFHR